MHVLTYENSLNLNVIKEVSFAEIMIHVHSTTIMVVFVTLKAN